MECSQAIFTHTEYQVALVDLFHNMFLTFGVLSFRWGELEAERLAWTSNDPGFASSYCFKNLTRTEINWSPDIKPMNGLPVFTCNTFKVAICHQDDYRRCRAEAEVLKILVTSLGDSCQFVYIFTAYFFKNEPFSNLNLATSKCFSPGKNRLKRSLKQWNWWNKAIFC